MNNDKQNRSPFKNPLVMFLIISVIATIILNAAMISLQSLQKEEISYNEFVTMLDDGKVDEVIINRDEIDIYAKPDADEAKGSAIVGIFGGGNYDRQHMKSCSKSLTVRTSSIRRRCSTKIPYLTLY